MPHRSLAGQRLLALFMLGWVAFNYPLLVLLEDAGNVLGLPASYVYVFAVWAVLIALMGWVAEHGVRQSGRHGGKLERHASSDNTEK